MVENISSGDELIFNGEIISSSGVIIFKYGDKVIVDEVIKHGGFYTYGNWIEERIIGIKLKNHYGIWFLSNFLERQKTD